MAFSWVNKVNGVDDILAEDINAIANEVVALSENAGGSSGGGSFKGTVDKYTDLPTEATEGDIYFVNNYYSDFDFTKITYNTLATNGAMYEVTFKDFYIFDDTSNNQNILGKVFTDFGITLNFNIGDKVDFAPNEKYLLLVKYNNNIYSAIISKLNYSCFDDGEGGSDIVRYIYFRENGYKVNGIDSIAFPISNIRIRPTAYYLKNIDDIKEYPKGAYIYNGSEWVHM